jgi:hypothetical protein
MSVEKLSRDRGTITRCGNGAHEHRPDCAESFFTGLTAVKHHHAAARGKGWGKSQVDGFRRAWLCPSHKTNEKQAIADEKATRKREREEERAKKKAATAERKAREKEEAKLRKQEKRAADKAWARAAEGAGAA